MSDCRGTLQPLLRSQDRRIESSRRAFLVQQRALPEDLPELRENRGWDAPAALRKGPGQSTAALGARSRGRGREGLGAPSFALRSTRFPRGGRLIYFRVLETSGFDWTPSMPRKQGLQFGVHGNSLCTGGQGCQVGLTDKRNGLYCG